MGRGPLSCHSARRAGPPVASSQERTKALACVCGGQCSPGWTPEWTARTWPKCCDRNWVTWVTQGAGRGILPISGGLGWVQFENQKGVTSCVPNVGPSHSGSCRPQRDRRDRFVRILQRTNTDQMKLLPSQSKSWAQLVRKTPSSLPTQCLLRCQNLPLPPSYSFL